LNVPPHLEHISTLHCEILFCAQKSQALELDEADSDARLSHWKQLLKNIQWY